MKKIAVVGVGFMGKMHLGIWLNLPGAEVSALCDVRPDALSITSLEAGGNIQTRNAAVDLSRVRKYRDFSAMLEEGGFDIVDICLPTFLHADHAIRALEKGYHVFCEKPLAMNPRETDRIVSAVKKTGRLMSVGQCLRYWPAYVEVKRLIDGGSMGKVRYAEFARYSAPPTWGWENWLLDGKRSGNAALDLHIHDVDMILWLFGMPRSVRSNGAREKDGTFSHISTVYGFPDVTVVSTGGWICAKSFSFNMRAFWVLEKGTIELDFSKKPVVKVYPAEGDARELPLPDGDGYLHELTAFLSGVERGRLEETVTVESAAQSVFLATEEIRSAREGKEIAIKG